MLIKHRILYADAHDDTAMAISIFLSRRGFDVVRAADFAEAVKLIEEHYFDLYLLERIFPDGCGIELCRRITQSYPNRPVLFFSTIALWKERSLAISSGARDYLFKPDDLKRLPDVIEQSLLSRSSCLSTSRISFNDRSPKQSISVKRSRARAVGSSHIAG
jgi:DNA-binding response OmpR family regulator